MFNFTPEVIREIFQTKLPEYIQQLNEAFNRIPLGQISGLAPTGQGGPFDKCIINGAWIPAQQALHGGPIPMMSGALGSRGIPEVWPHMQTQWAQNGFGNQKRYFDQTKFLSQPKWSDLNWNGESKSGGGPVPAVTPIDAYGGYSLRTCFHNQEECNDNNESTKVSQRFNSDGSRRKRGNKKDPNRKRGGV